MKTIPKSDTVDVVMQEDTNTMPVYEIPLRVSVYIDTSHPEKSCQSVAMWFFQLISKTRGRDLVALGVESPGMTPPLIFSVEMDGDSCQNVTLLYNQRLAEADRLESKTLWRWLPKKLRDNLKSDPTLALPIQKSKVEEV